MATLIRNYYKQADAADLRAPPMTYGSVMLVGPNDPSPFLGNLVPREMLQSFENNMFRAPIYEHKPSDTDFLVVRTSKGNFYVRTVEALFVVGQECPKMEVPAPNSKRANSYLRDRLLVYIERLFATQDTVRVDDVRRAFTAHSEPNVRKRLKEMAEFRRGGSRYDDDVSAGAAGGGAFGGLDAGAWEWNPKVKRHTETELRNMVCLQCAV
jgi:transcription initiation factor TFIID subunit 1